MKENHVPFNDGCVFVSVIARNEILSEVDAARTYRYVWIENVFAWIPCAALFVLFGCVAVAAPKYDM